MYNKVILVGNLTRDIEIRYIANGTAIAKSAIATSYKYKAQNGEQKDETCFLDFNIFGRSAEVANQYLRKGSKVLLEGRLVLEQWTGQDGTNRSKHALRVDTMKMLGSKSDIQEPYTNSAIQSNDNNNNGSANDFVQSQPNKVPEINISDKDIPF